MTTHSSDAHYPPQGAQRLSLQTLQAWEKLEYGMFIHFGMSTFDGREYSKGNTPSTLYAPDQLDVDQWVQVACDAGMKYAVLTTKHVSGHCLWPSKQTDYHVGTSSNQTDVVEQFIKACEKHGIMPGLYYCTLDNHHVIFEPGRFPRSGPLYEMSSQYALFVWEQLTELLTQYGPVGEIWIDIPRLLGNNFRLELYNHLSTLQPNVPIMMNHGFGDGSKLNYNNVWPTDLMAIERWLPSSHRGFDPWFQIPERAKNGAYYIPGEVCDPIGYDWFYVEGDVPRSDAELLGMRLLCKERHANLLLNVPPNKQGIIPKMHVDALMRLRKNYEKIL